MLQIPTEIAIGSFSLIGILTGYIWNEHSKKLKHIENRISTFSFSEIHSSLASIKTDIQWIKHELKKF